MSPVSWTRPGRPPRRARPARARSGRGRHGQHGPGGAEPAARAGPAARPDRAHVAGPAGQHLPLLLGHRRRSPPRDAASYAPQGLRPGRSPGDATRWPTSRRCRRRRSPTTFQCVTGWHVPDVPWTGVRLSDLLDRAAPTSAAVGGAVPRRSTAPTPMNMTLDQARADDVIVALQMYGKPVTHDHGGPVRIYVGLDVRLQEHQVALRDRADRRQRSRATGRTAATRSTGSSVSERPCAPDGSPLGASGWSTGSVAILMGDLPASPRRSSTTAR